MASAGKQKRVSASRAIHKAIDIGNEFLGATNVELPVRQHEVHLDVHFPEDNSVLPGQGPGTPSAPLRLTGR
jgi:hypothetical protein